MITEAAAIDLVVTAILKSASSEVVKKGIASISDRLTKAFESQSHEQIVKVVEEDNLIEPLSSLAQVSLNNSVVIGISESLAKPEQKAQLFESVLRACFAASKENKSDVWLPGTFAGPKYVSVFCTGDKIPSIERRGAKIWIEDHPAAFYAILPAEDPVGLAEGFKKIIFNQRNEGFEAYLNSHKWSGQYISLYKIASITAGSVYPKLPSLFDKKSLVDGERIGIDDYFGGIQSMLNYSRLYPNITVLPDDEIVKLRELARKIEGINMAIEK